MGLIFFMVGIIELTNVPLGLIDLMKASKRLMNINSNLYFWIRVIFAILWI